ncbi:DedA family protein [Heyndrickxia ginsengihumi]
MIQGMGIIGVCIVMLIEGSSLPFPGVFILVSYGAVSHLNCNQILFTAVLMAITYTISSFIPYYISSALQKKIPKKFQKGIEKAQCLFQRFGVWTIAFTRPFSIGNYISYVAGLCKIPRWKYSILTFIGIYPWSIAVLFLGKSYLTFVYEINKQFSYSTSVLYPVGIMLIVLLFLLVSMKCWYRYRANMKE